MLALSYIPRCYMRKDVFLFCSSHCRLKISCFQSDLFQSNLINIRFITKSGLLLNEPNVYVQIHFCTFCTVFQLCPTLCDPMDCSLPDSFVHGDSPARILKKVTMPSHRGSSQPRERTQVSHIAGGFFTI